MAYIGGTYACMHWFDSQFVDERGSVTVALAAAILGSQSLTYLMLSVH